MQESEVNNVPPLAVGECLIRDQAIIIFRQIFQKLEEEFSEVNEFLSGTLAG